MHILSTYNMWRDLPAPIIIAHRGSSAHAPENTLAAFTLAIQEGAKAIEFDVKLSADKKVVVIHDQTVDRTTNGRGNVCHLPLATLKKLDAGFKFGEVFAGECIPTLEEIFETVGKQLHMNIELTNYATPGDDLVNKVIELVKKHAVQERVLFSSFFLRNLQIAQRILPEVPCGLLTWAGMMGFPARAWMWRKINYAIHPHLSSTTQGFVSRMHAANRRVNVWTVNQKNDMINLIGIGVDGIFTDDPALLAGVLGRAM